MKKTIIAFVLASLGATVVNANPVVPGNSNSNQAVRDYQNKVVTIRVSHVVKENTPKAKSLVRFKELLEQKFPGRVKVEISHNSAAFKDREEIEALELGVVDIIVPAMGKVASAYKIPEFELFDLPFLFATSEEAFKLSQSEIAQSLLGNLSGNSKTTQALALWPNDFRGFIGPRLLKTPKDFKGYSARVDTTNENSTQKLFFNALNIKNTTFLALADVYKAMKKEGKYKVDISDNTLTNMNASKLYEATPYITVSNHNFMAYTVLANKRWMNSLPEDIRMAVISTTQELGQYHWKLAQEEGKVAVKELEKNGAKVYTLTEAEKEEFKKVIVPVHEAFLTTVNRDLLVNAYNFLKKK